MSAGMPVMSAGRCELSDGRCKLCQLEDVSYVS